MLIGDGCLKVKPGPYYEYVICHSIKQKEYIEYKLNLFHSILGGKKPKLHYYKGKLGESLRFSRCHKYFRLLHRRLYSKNGKKYITDKVLNRLTPHAIAIWYMDDGGLKKNKHMGRVTSSSMHLFTYCSKEEAVRIVQYFNEKWGISPKALKYYKKDQWNIVFNTSESRKLDELLKPYIIPSMLYKLPSSHVPRVPNTLRGDDIV